MKYDVKTAQLLCDSLASHFGPTCEVVYHDLTLDYEHTIVAIANGHVTNRSVGGPGTNAGLKALKETDPNANYVTYISHAKDGRALKSTSIYFRSPNGTIIASLCINQDISDMLLMQNSLNNFLATSKEENECFANDISETLECMINEAVTHVGKPVLRMGREDKIEVIRFLESHGAFLVKRSAERVCAVLDISRNSFYSYLDDVRKAVS